MVSSKGAGLAHAVYCVVTRAVKAGMIRFPVISESEITPLRLLSKIEQVSQQLNAWTYNDTY